MSIYFFITLQVCKIYVFLLNKCKNIVKLKVFNNIGMNIFPFESFLHKSFSGFFLGGASKMSLSFNHIRTDYYIILEVTPLTSYDDIHKSYRALSKKYHPDLFPDKEFAETKMKEIVEAFNTLKEPETRQRYDSRRLYLPRPYNRKRSHYLEKPPTFWERLFGKKEKKTPKTIGGKDPVENVFSMSVPLLKTRKPDSVDLAINEFANLVKVDPKNPDLFYNLGVACYYRGEYTRAIEFFQISLQLDPEFADAETMTRLLKDGEELEKQRAAEAQQEEEQVTA